MNSNNDEEELRFSDIDLSNVRLRSPSHIPPPVAPNVPSTDKLNQTTFLENKNYNRTRSSAALPTFHTQSEGGSENNNSSSKKPTLWSGMQFVRPKKNARSVCFGWGNGVKYKETFKKELFPFRTITKIAAGGTHAVALDSNGQVYSWGEGKLGQLCFGESTPRLDAPKAIDVKAKVVDVWAGFSQTAILTEENHLLFFGLIGNSLNFQPLHYNLFDQMYVKIVVFGPSCAMILTEPLSEIQRIRGCDVYVIGSSFHGHLGIPSCKEVQVPTLATALSNIRLNYISASEYHVVGCSIDGSVYIWGSIYSKPSAEQFDSYEVSYDFELIESPRKIEGELEVQMISKVQCGSGFTLALSSNGHAYAWGLGRSGIHGLGDQELVKEPRKLNFFGCKIDNISSGGKHSFSWSNHIEFNIPRYTKPIGSSCSSISSSVASLDLHGKNNTNAHLSQSLKPPKKQGAQSCRSGRKRTTNVPSKTIEIYSWGDGREYRLGQPDQNIYNFPTPINTSHLITKVHDICCTYRGVIALVDSLDLAIQFKDQIYYYTPLEEEEEEVSALIKQLSIYFSLEKREVCLVDDTNTPFSNDTKVNYLRERFQTVSMRISASLFDFQSSSLILIESPSSPGIPIVKGGTIDNLLDWLIFPVSTGHEYNSIFLNTFPTFISPSEFITKLIQRFSSTRSYFLDYHCPNSEIQEIKIIRLRILNIIRKLLANHSDSIITKDDAGNINDSTLFDLLSFINTVEGFDVNNIKRLLKTLLEDAKRESSLFPAPINNPLSALHSKSWDLFKYPPLETARQLTAVDYYYYFLKIESREFINQSWNKARKEILSPNILKMIRRFNQMNEWITKLILTSENMKVRKKVVETLIEIADECFKLNNFNSVFYILSAFSSQPVYRLGTIWNDPINGISSAHANKLSELKRVAAFERGMVLYREHFAKALPPKIPYLGLYLQDYTFIDDGNANYLDADETVINFDKRTKLSKIFIELTILFNERYKIAFVDEIVEILLCASGFEGDHAQIAYDLSKHIEQDSGTLSNDNITEYLVNKNLI